MWNYLYQSTPHFSTRESYSIKDTLAEIVLMYFQIVWHLRLGGLMTPLYRNSINFRHGLIFINFGRTKNTEIYSAHAMP